MKDRRKRYGGATRSYDNTRLKERRCVARRFMIISKKIMVGSVTATKLRMP